MPTNQNSAANVSTGKPCITGAIFVAPAGTALPDDPTTALAADYKCLGYVSEDGLTQTITRDSETIKAWGGDTVKTPQTEYQEEFGFTLIEALNTEVLKVVYGSANVTTTQGVRTATANSAELESHVWVFDTVMSNGKARRIAVPDAKITEIGDITYVDNEPIGYELTVTAVPDDSGNTSYTYDDVGV